MWCDCKIPLGRRKSFYNKLYWINVFFFHTKITCKSSEQCIYVYSESAMFHVTPNENGSSALFFFLYILNDPKTFAKSFRLTVYFRIRVNYILVKMWHFDIKWKIFYDCTETSILLWLPEWNDRLDWIFHQAGHIQLDREITMLIINTNN